MLFYMRSRYEFQAGDADAVRVPKAKDQQEGLHRSDTHAHLVASVCSLCQLRAQCTCASVLFLGSAVASVVAFAQIAHICEP